MVDPELCVYWGAWPSGPLTGLYATELSSLSSVLDPELGVCWCARPPGPLAGLHATVLSSSSLV